MIIRMLSSVSFTGFFLASTVLAVTPVERARTVERLIRPEVSERLLRGLNERESRPGEYRWSESQKGLQKMFDTLTPEDKELLSKPGGDPMTERRRYERFWKLAVDHDLVKVNNEGVDFSALSGELGQFRKGTAKVEPFRDVIDSLETVKKASRDNVRLLSAVDRVARPTTGGDQLAYASEPSGRMAREVEATVRDRSVVAAEPIARLLEKGRKVAEEVGKSEGGKKRSDEFLDNLSEVVEQNLTLNSPEEMRTLMSRLETTLESGGPRVFDVIAGQARIGKKYSKKLREVLEEQAKKVGVTKLPESVAEIKKAIKEKMTARDYDEFMKKLENEDLVLGGKTPSKEFVDHLAEMLEGKDGKPLPPEALTTLVNKPCFNKAQLKALAAHGRNVKAVTGVISTATAGLLFKLSQDAERVLKEEERGQADRTHTGGATGRERK